MAGPESPAECVVNISEGRDRRVVDAVAAAAGSTLLDVHVDGDHHRSVLTLGGGLAEVEDAARAVTTEAVARIDLSSHAGAHPRLGAVDVVPFVPLGLAGRAATPFGATRDARDAFCAWAGAELALPCFCYGPERSLPEVRRGAFRTLAPDAGPPRPHPTAGAVAVGVRSVLVAYNVWIAPALEGPDGPAAALGAARILADRLRRPGLRTLGLAVSGGAQVSCNVTEPDGIRLTDVFDAVSEGATALGCRAVRGELVGLLPASALAAVPPTRWPEIGVDASVTIEARLATGRG